MIVWIDLEPSLLEYVASLLDYVRLLREDPSAADMVIDRVEKIETALRDNGIEWMDLKKFLLEIKCMSVNCNDPH